MTGAAAVAMPQISRAQTATLRLQTSWPATDIFAEMCQQYITRVNEMAGGRLKIDMLHGGAVVHPFQVLDGVHGGQIDAAHTVTVYWYGKHKAASLFGTGPVFGFNANEGLGWIYNGGGKELFEELQIQIMKLNVKSFFAMPMPTQPLGWFKKPITERQRRQGHEVPHRRSRGRPDAGHGHGRRAASGRRNRAGDGARRDRRASSSTTRPRTSASARRTWRRTTCSAATIRRPSTSRSCSTAPSSTACRRSTRRSCNTPPRSASSANEWLAMRQYSDDLQELINKDKVNVLRTPQGVFDAQIKAWDGLIATLGKDAFMKKVMDSQKAWVKKVVYYNMMNATDYKGAFNHHFPSVLKTLMAACGMLGPAQSRKGGAQARRPTYFRRMVPRGRRC